MKCGHCFYWRNLNRRDDLTKDEIFSLSRSMGRIENLSLSGGEPFLRSEFAEICSQFIRQNHVRQIYVPTNGYFTDRAVAQITKVLKEDIDLLAIELSLDGMPEFHNTFRGTPGAFERAMQTYDALAQMQAYNPRLRIHSVSTATNENMKEIWQLTNFLFDRCPQIDHHNLAMIRGDPRNSSLSFPDPNEYRRLYEHIRHTWLPREIGRYGSIVEPMLQWAKLKTAERQTQVIPCRAGRLSAVVYANGDVSICEWHKPVGNLRDKAFLEIWASARAQELRAAVAAKECYCTSEMFLWPSIVYQPAALARAMLGGRVWQHASATTSTRSLGQ